MSSGATEVVRTTTGIVRRRSSDLSSDNTARPSFRGRFRSRRIRSGRGASAYGGRRRTKAIASTPSRTTWRLLGTRLFSSARFVRRASARLSSTSRISIVMEVSGLHRVPEELADALQDLGRLVGLLEEA